MWLWCLRKRQDDEAEADDDVPYASCLAAAADDAADNDVDVLLSDQMMCLNLKVDAAAADDDNADADDADVQKMKMLRRTDRRSN